MKKLANIVGAFGLVVLALVGVREVVQVARSGVSCSVPNNLQNGTTADATQVMANFNALVACFGNAAAAGANSDITSLAGLTTPLSGAQGGTQRFWGGTSAGTNTVTVTTVTPTTGFSKAVGQEVCFIPGGTNTGAVTLNVNGTGAAGLTRLILTSTGVTEGTLVGGELVVSGSTTCAIFQGITYLMVGRGADRVGEIIDFGYAGCPTGWQEVTGAQVNSTNFPDYNTIVSTTWGTGGGNPLAPDLRGRATFSRDGTGTRLTTDQSGALAGNTVGTTGGLQNQTLTVAQLPVITPSFSGNSFTIGGAQVNFTVNAGGAPAVQTLNNTGAGGTSTSITPTGSISSFGSGNSHPVTPPLGVVTKCVKL